MTLDTVQLYPSGAKVNWPATLTVVPGPESEQPQSGEWELIAATVGGGLAVFAGVTVLARRVR